MTAVLPQPIPAAAPPRSEGVWRAAWRRFRRDRVGMAGAAIVGLFVLLMLLAALGLVASDWQVEKGVPNAPPTFIGPAPKVADSAIAAPTGPRVDLSDVDPLAPRYKEWAERAKQYETVERKRSDTLPFGADRLGRDVLAKTVKGTQISVFVGVLAAVVATLIGTVLGALAGFFGGKTGDFLEWLYNVFTANPEHPADFRLCGGRRPRRAVGRADPRAHGVDRS